MGGSVEFTLFYVQPLDIWNVRCGGLANFERVVAGGGSSPNAANAELGNAAPSCNLRLGDSGAERPDHGQKRGASGSKPGQLRSERRFPDTA